MHVVAYVRDSGVPCRSARAAGAGPCRHRRASWRAAEQPRLVRVGWRASHIQPDDRSQKYRNVKDEPRVALSIVDANNPFRYLEIRGTVERVDPDPDNAFINSMAKKYMGEDVYPWHRPGDERVVLVIKPEHTTRMG